MECEHSLNGYHRCLTHNEGFRNNISAQAHYSQHHDQCDFRWVCLDCGEEVPES